MEALVASAIGILTAAGVYLSLRGRTFPVVLGLTFVSYAVNLCIFVAGGIRLDAPPIVGLTPSMTDPLPQALVLTAIVIGFGMSAYLVVLAIRLRAADGHDHVDADAEDDAS